MQQDAIVIYHIEDTSDNQTLSQYHSTLRDSLSIEFSNSKSKELFDIDLQIDTASLSPTLNETAYEKLTLPQFIQLKSSNDQHMNDEAKRFHAMRVLLESECGSKDELSLNASLELISLKEIIMDKEPKDSESFIKMSVDDESEQTQQSLMLKRTSIIFNDKECVLLNFQDLTAFKNLKIA